MNWEPNIEAKFKLMISRIPIFHRAITQGTVVKEAEEIARARNSQTVEEQDVVAAFFTDVPTPFYSMMIRLLDQNGFDYKKYGFPKRNT
jgi:hypothetical protein